MLAHTINSTILTILLLCLLPAQEAAPDSPERSDPRVCCASFDRQVWRERPDVDSWSKESDELRPIQRADRVTIDESLAALHLRRPQPGCVLPRLDKANPTSSHNPLFPGHLFFCVMLS